MEQLPHNGTATSIAAAEFAKGSAATDRARILNLVRAAGIHGLTRDEIAVHSGISPNTVRPRVVELVNSGQLRPSGEIRRNASGRACEVLEAAI